MRQQWSIQRSAAVLRVPGPQDDKYTRGVLGFRTGSESYPGAAVLGVQAAWRTGVGMVRYLGPERAGALVLAAHPETVLASGRVQAWVIGSGTDPEHRLAEEESQLREVLGGTEPVVVDAGALDLAAEGRAPVILTPHDREHERLRVQLGIGEPEPTRVETAAHTARVLGAVVVLKGARTIIAAPDGAFDSSMRRHHGWPRRGPGMFWPVRSARSWRVGQAGTSPCRMRRQPGSGCMRGRQRGRRRGGAPAAGRSPRAMLPTSCVRSSARSCRRGRIRVRSMEA